MITHCPTCLQEEDELDYSDDDGSDPGDDVSEDYGEELYSDEGDGEGEGEERQLVLRPGRPDRPLPVDVWRARHEVKQEVKQVGARTESI